MGLTISFLAILTDLEKGLGKSQATNGIYLMQQILKNCLKP